jgi:RimJ/RimL family protein N-acetyltransferase
VTFTVREATAADVEACLDVLEKVVAEGTWLGTEAPLDRTLRGERLLAAIEDERRAHLVAIAGTGDVAGQLGLDMAPYGVAEFGMCVAPAWRGQGAGAALVSAAVDAARARHAHKVAIQVWPHNGAAIRLYRRHGFRMEGRLVRHYRRRNGELWDAVIMGLVLDTDSPGSPLPDSDVSHG